MALQFSVFRVSYISFYFSSHRKIICLFVYLISINFVFVFYNRFFLFLGVLVFMWHFTWIYFKMKHWNENKNLKMLILFINAIIKVSNGTWDVERLKNKCLYPWTLPTTHHSQYFEYPGGQDSLEWNFSLEVNIEYRNKTSSHMS